MSFTSYQQVKIDKMLTFSNDFKKLYWRIPKEFTHNYYYEKFLFHTAEISSNIELVQQYSKTKTGHEMGLDMKFDVKMRDDGVTSLLKYIENQNTPSLSIVLQLIDWLPLASNKIIPKIAKLINKAFSIDLIPCDIVKKIYQLLLDLLQEYWRDTEIANCLLAVV